MSGRVVVSTDELADHLADWVVVDCRHDLLDPEAGPAAYAKGHIPGAHHAHLDRDLSAPVTGQTGRHPLPEPEAFVAVCRRLGIDRDSTVVVYDDLGGAYAARLWWMLRDYGHTQAFLLDGGLTKWVEEGRDIQQATPSASPGRFEGRPDSMPTTDAAGVVDGTLLPVDVRDADRFAGRSEPIDAVAGHIPGAVNVPFVDLLNSDRTLRRADELLGRLPQADQPTAFYCGSGVTACLGIAAAIEAGLPTPALYPGSWSEWIRDPQRPVERAD